MKYQFFTVAVHSYTDAQRELNNFCIAHTIASVDKQFVSDGDKSFWAFCVTYQDSNQQLYSTGKSKIDYREVLNEKDFAIYAKLRTLRKDISAKQRVPAYALFTNEQLSSMILKRVNSLTAMNAIPGIGSARMEKYGAIFLSALRQEFIAHFGEKKNEANKN